MSRKKTLSGKKKIALLVGAAALAGGTAVVMTGTSQASVACDGLVTALQNNEKFIADQRANPDAQSEARIANRQAVIEQIKRQQEASGCEVGGGAGGGGEAAPPAESQPAAPPAESQPPPVRAMARAPGTRLVAARVPGTRLVAARMPATRQAVARATSARSCAPARP